MNKNPAHALDLGDINSSNNNLRLELETVSGASDVDEFETKKPI